MKESAGYRFRKAVEEEFPLQIVGAINAYAAMMAGSCGYRALYLSGAGVANAAYGIPDVGLTTLDNVVEEARKITDVVEVPLLVDIDTGWGSARMVARTIRAMERAGVAAVHIEDQWLDKRCGHLPGKGLVSQEEMVARIKAALNARVDPSFVIMSRTDAYGVEGIDCAIERCRAYEEAGADMHFIEALSSLDEYQRFVDALERPILANMTEFGMTPLFTREQLKSVGVSLILYPLSAWRAMNLSALKVYQEIRQEGTQKHVIDMMQTREELYGFLNYLKDG